MFKISIKTQLRYFPAITMFMVFVLGFNIGLTMVRSPVFVPRSPSSASFSSLPVSNSLKASALVELKCSGSEKVITTETPLVRLKGCLGETGVPTEVINRTTGVSATVLDANDYFTTDYFHLNSGTNIISVTYINQNGEAQIIDYKIRVTN